jgi:hypothetical protein
MEPDDNIEKEPIRVKDYDITLLYKCPVTGKVEDIKASEIWLENYGSGTIPICFTCKCGENHYCHVDTFEGERPKD